MRSSSIRSLKLKFRPREKISKGAMIRTYCPFGIRRKEGKKLSRGFRGRSVDQTREWCTQELWGSHNQRKSINKKKNGHGGRSGDKPMKNFSVKNGVRSLVWKAESDRTSERAIVKKYDEMSSRKRPKLW